MAELFIDGNICTLCGKCIDVCPFNALEMKDEVSVNAACRMCGLCIKACPEKAIEIKETRKSVDKTKWNGFLVYAEFFDGKLHPVTIELIGISKKLAAKVNMPVFCLIAGYGVEQTAAELLEYGVDGVFVYDDERLRNFAVDSYANVLEKQINETKPSVVLIGGTSIGRSLAPRLSTRFRTGLTADCTTLDIKENSDLIQIRPAFGGNIMARIITPYTRPQFATVRYKVMDRAEKGKIKGKIFRKPVSDEMVDSNIEVLKIRKKESTVSITESDILVVAGQGVKDRDDLYMIIELAEKLGGEYAVTRPMVEKGWADYTRQIGLSGRTVKPKLIITCGVSGAIQFTSCMNAADTIVAINSDPKAPIFGIAHYGIVGDIYNIVPAFTRMLEGA